MFKFSLNPGEAYCMDEQLEMCNELGIKNLEISWSMNGKRFLDLDSDSVIKKAISNKVYIPLLNMSKGIELIHMEELEETVCKCSLIGIEYLNIGDFKIYENENNITACLKKYCELHNVKLCVENQKSCSINENSEAFFKDPENHDLCMVFNPLEFVRTGLHPFLNVFYNGKMKNRISFLRICDGIYADGTPKLPGDGSAEIKELTSALHARNYRGYLSMCTYFENQTIDDYKMIFKKLFSLITNM